LNVTIPSGAPQQFGFALGAPRATVTNIAVGGTNGAFSSSGVPRGTSGSWITLSPLLPGSAVAQVQTTGTAKGAFTVMPASAAQPKPAFFAAVRCPLSKGTPAGSSAFQVDKHLTYSKASGAWPLVVTIASAGRVSAIQEEPTIGTGSSKSQHTAMPLVHARSLGLKSPGKVTLMLKLTPQGQKAFMSRSAISVKLNVAFDPTNGPSSAKILTLTLRK
jgi:hypothetical protein